MFSLCVFFNVKIVLKGLKDNVLYLGKQRVDGVDIGVLCNWYDEELLHFLFLSIQRAAL